MNPVRSTRHSSHESGTAAMTAVPRLSVRKLSKLFNGVPALSNFAVTVQAGTIEAIVGANGSGKSTFIKLLAGLLKPEPGSSAEIDGRPFPLGSGRAATAFGCRFVHQELGLIDNLSVADNLAVQRGYPTRLWTIHSRGVRDYAAQCLGRVGLDLNPGRLVRDISPTQRTQVAIARAVAPSTDAAVKLLVLDEPTATLPGQEVDALLAMLRSVKATGVAIIYVSHHLEEVFASADHVTVLRDGIRVGSTDVAEIDREKMIELMAGDAVDMQAPHRQRKRQAVAGVPRLRVEDLRYEPQLTNASFTTAQGEVVGLAGLSGSGSEHVLSAIFGGVARDGGTVRVDGRTIPAGKTARAVRAGIRYLPPDRKRLAGIMDHSAAYNLTIGDVQAFWQHLHLNRNAEAAVVREWFDGLNVVPRWAPSQPLASFSGGNQQKILLARLLRCHPRVLLLDEPTQGVDVVARAEIHARILVAAAAGAAVVVSSTDIDELCVLSDRIVVFAGGVIATELDGTHATQAAVTRACLAGANT